jgi:hypothetical protein
MLIEETTSNYMGDVLDAKEEYLVVELGFKKT